MENQFIGPLIRKARKEDSVQSVVKKSCILNSNYVYVSGYGNAEQRIGKISILSVLVVCTIS